MLIGQHPDIMTAGALKRFPNGKQFNLTNRCTCGVHPNDCAFWSAVLSDLGVRPGDGDTEVAPQSLYGSVAGVSGRTVVLDCTHNADRLVQVSKELACNPRARLCVVYVERTALEIARIQVKTALRKGRIRDNPIERVKVITRGILIRREIIRAIKENPFGVTIVNVGYRDICQHPLPNLMKAWTMMGLDADKANLAFNDGTLYVNKPEHMIHGNSRLRAESSIQLQAPGDHTSYLKRHEKVYAVLLDHVSRLVRLPSVRALRRMMGHPR